MSRLVVDHLKVGGLLRYLYTVLLQHIMLEFMIYGASDVDCEYLMEGQLSTALSLRK
jgi:hypothetical protein